MGTCRKCKEWTTAEYCSKCNPLLETRRECLVCEGEFIITYRRFDPRETYEFCSLGCKAKYEKCQDLGIDYKQRPVKTRENRIRWRKCEPITIEGLSSGKILTEQEQAFKDYLEADDGLA